MTVCLKCGAENPLSNRYCARCEMPLPKSGAGETLLGGAALSARGGRGGTGQIASPPGTAETGPVTTPGVVPSPKTLAGVSPHKSKAEAAPAPIPQQTLFGIAPRGPQGAKPGPPATPSPAQTLLGVTAVAPNTTTANAEAPGNPAQGRTLLGVVPEHLKALEAARAAPAAGRGTSPLGPAAPVAGPPQHTLLGGAGGFEPVRNTSTILGGAIAAQLRPDTPAEPVAPPASAMPDTNPFGAAPRSAARVTAAESAPAATAAQPELPPLPSLPAPHAKTHLGVALPGIAPLRAGIAAAPAEPAQPTALEATQLPESKPATSLFLARPKLPKSALVLLGSGLVLLVSAAAFALLWKSQKPISAVLGIDASGRERIDMLCETCADGTKVGYAGGSAEFREHKAYLIPETPLALGSNTLTLRLEKPDGETDSVDVALPPIEYRIKPDTSTLSADPPRLTLKIEALPGTRVTLGETAVELDAQGRGELGLDLTGQLSGAASDVTSFEQSVRYLIVPPGGREHQGQLGVKISVTPLVLEAPGADTVTDMERFMLAGRTSKGAAVSIAGNPLSVDGSGRFAQLMSIDSVGETSLVVRATEPGLAPRFVPFKLQRVSNLTARADELKKGALSLSEVGRDIQKNVGRSVLVKGKVAEVKVDGHRTILVLEAEGDCGGGPCLARLIYGGLRKLARGKTVTAIGTLRGSAGSASVPELEVSLLL